MRREVRPDQGVGGHSNRGAACPLRAGARKRERPGQGHHDRRTGHREHHPRQGGDLCGLFALLEHAGLTFSDLANVYIGGGFGRFLNLEKAVIIGLIPDLPREKFHYIGNSSLMGSYIVLVSQDFRQRQLELGPAHDLCGSQFRSQVHGAVYRGLFSAAHRSPPVSQRSTPDPEMQALSHQQQAQTGSDPAGHRETGGTERLAGSLCPAGASRSRTTGGAIRLAFLGTTLEFHAPGFQAIPTGAGLSPKPADHLVALHYLLGEAPMAPTGTWITFREFPGGQFYWEAFLSRSVRPLIERMGNAPDVLREHLRRFSATVTPLSDGGLQATIRALGAIDLMLVYRFGDDEFPSSADALYDACARRLLCAEDAAYLASRFCIGLL